MSAHRTSRSSLLPPAIGRSEAAFTQCAGLAGGHYTAYASGKAVESQACTRFPRCSSDARKFIREVDSRFHIASPRDDAVAAVSELLSQNRQPPDNSVVND